MGSVLIGYLCALLAYLYLQFTNPMYNRDGVFLSHCTQSLAISNHFNRHLHTRRPRVRVLGWTSDGKRHFKPTQEWRLHTFRRYGLGPNGFEAGSWRAVCTYDPSISAGTVRFIGSLNLFIPKSLCDVMNLSYVAYVD